MKKKIFGVLGAAAACLVLAGGVATADPVHAAGYNVKGPYNTLPECNEVRAKYESKNPGPCSNWNDPGDPIAYYFGYWD